MWSSSGCWRGAVLATLLLVVCAPVPSGGMPDSAPGALVADERLPGGDGIEVHHIRYRSRAADGHPIVVSGQLLVPVGRRQSVVLSLGHGTTGLADRCAPSRRPGPMEDSPVAAALRLGWTVAATDYEGLGTPGTHTYAVNLSAGRSVLDAARAAVRLTGEDDADVVLWGHSQGGGAVLSAADQAADYAPELRVRAVVAGAPAVELVALTQALWRSPRKGFVLMGLAGIAAAYPGTPLRAVLTDEGMHAAAKAARSCLDFILDVRGSPDAFFRRDPTDIPAVRRRLEQNSPGRRPPPVPVLVFGGRDDLLIPPAVVDRLVARWCAAPGRQFSRYVYDADHLGVVELAQPAAMAWVEDRLAGRPLPASPCR